VQVHLVSASFVRAPGLAPAVARGYRRSRRRAQAPGRSLGGCL